jgi:amino acid adenylation domain-containing protein
VSLAVGLSPLQRIWALDRQHNGGPMRPTFAAFRVAGPLRVDLLEHALDEVAQRHDILRADVRPALRRVDRDRHLLTLEPDPVACDATSAWLLVRELIDVYRALARGVPPPQAPALPYARLMARQRRRWPAGVRERGVAHWSQKLSGLPLAAPLPGDAASRHGLGPGAVPFVIPARLGARARDLAAASDVAFETIVLSAFLFVVQRHCGLPVHPVALTVPGRQHPDAEGVVGCLVNHLVLDVRAHADLTFEAFIAAVAAERAQALEHADVPLLKVVQALRGSGRRAPRGHQRLFRTTFSMIDLPPLRRRFCDLALTSAALGEPVLSSELALRAGAVGQRVEGELLYARERFSPALAAAIAQHLANALRAAVESPQTPIRQFALAGARERRRLTRGPSRRSEPALLHELFEAQRRRTPQAVAVVHRKTELSYRELDERASRLADRLRALGAGPDARIAISLEPCADLLVAILAVLKSGAAYVPIAVTTPAERRRSIIRSSRASVLIGEGLECRAIEKEGGSVRSQSTVTPDNLAYVIHTSGSTGEPKGVMVTHRGICNTLRWRQAAIPLLPTDRMLLTFSFSFDASLFELFQPLIAGAAVVIPDAEPGGDPTALAREVRRQAITVLGAVPSVLVLLVAQPHLERCRSLRVVYSGGEPLSAELAEAVRRRLGVQLYNMYGPTETSVEATTRRCDPEARVTIGHPIANVSAYVLDDGLEPAPVGVGGELYIGGAGVARGYSGDPALTAARFVPDPFSRAPGARMYRTGDVCRWLPEAGLEFLGRRDDQVKLRGHRIELGEVEAALRSSPAVQEAAAVVRDQRLVGYVVPHDAASEDIQALRGHLRGRLPSYMIPSAFVFLELLPRGANGKVDRRALPAPARRPPATTRDDRSGRPLERFLAGLWRQVLDLRAVGDEDDFFELGGDSIRVAMLTHKLEQALGDYVHTVALYDAPTIASLAGYLRLNYPEAVRRRFGPHAVQPASSSASEVDAAALQTVRKLIRTSRSRPPGGPKNPPAVFVLSPPRAGSTLFRVMLGGHPRLFAPPELQLLNYGTLRERRAALSSDRDAFWLQGTVRALMQLHGCTAAHAEQLMEDYERRDLSVKAFYATLQRELGNRVLVDKTPTYALDLATLRRAEEDFEGARYIHLVRHPSASIASFEEAKLHVFFPPFLSGPHNFSPAALAELIWDISHENILTFLRDVPADRRHAVRYEELVRDPRRVVWGVTHFLGLRFTRAMIEPYKQDQRRLMTDAPHALGRMLGDVKFHSHGRVRADTADRREGRESRIELADVTRELARELGYEPRRARPRSVVALGAKAPGRPFFCVHPAGGTASCYDALAQRLESPLYAFRSPSLERDAPLPRSMPRLAATYLDELARLQPHGPYTVGGWSFGGLVAVEMALQLAGAGAEIGDVILIDSHLALPGAAYGRLGTRQFVLDFLRERAVDTARVAARSRGVVAVALEEAKRAGVAAPALQVDEFRRILSQHERVYRAHVLLARRYIPGARLRRIVLLEPVDRRRDRRAAFGDWSTIADVVERRVVPGDHFTMLHEPNVRAIAECLRPRLRAQSGSPSTISAAESGEHGPIRAA